MVHGYPETLQVFARLAPQLAAAHQVLALDWPGLGASDPWPGGVTPTLMGERLVRLMDALGLERAHLFGADMGGQPCLAAARDRPDRVPRVVVSNSLVVHDAPTSWELSLLRRLGFNKFALRHLPRLVFARALSTFLAGEAALPAEVEADFRQHFLRPEVRETLVRMCVAYQARLPALYERLPETRPPVLALWGETDRHFPPAHAHRLVERLPAGRAVVLPGRGHWMHWTHPDEVADQVLAFLAEGEPPTTC